jgi:hypothetical protein
MRTWVELFADGHTMVGHVTDEGLYKWTHPPGKPDPRRPCNCEEDKDEQ